MPAWRDGERDLLERSVHAIAQHARDAYALIEELDAAGFPGDGATVLAAKRLRMQLLTTKGDLERELAGALRTASGATGQCTGSRGAGPLGARGAGAGGPGTATLGTRSARPVPLV